MKGLSHRDFTNPHGLGTHTSMLIDFYLTLIEKISLHTHNRPYT
jgi:hypothetical protein